ncbi:MAG: hypothetical protein EZS28_021934 [Streblomastix strix]|uniref:Uncharacterized protein n=1 Tax=Streblomastix strix TaxID=222440 RepID=A0A5J4VIS0_9EUKA|nr:MAG: hypothetical protein EZS28_021934 [Streblomastix strix]
MGQDQSTLNSSNIKEIFSKDVDLQQAEKILGKLSSEVILLSVTDLVKNANTSLCKSIRTNLGECKTEKELLLLNFLEVLVEKGAYLPYSRGMNALRIALTDSNLIEKVSKLIQQKPANETDQIIISPFTNIQTQLIRVFLFMMKGQAIEKSLLESCASNIERNVSALQTMIKDKYQFTQEKQIQEWQQDKEMENSLIQGIKTLQIVSSITQENMALLASHSLPKQLSTFIHLNCSDKLNCEYQIKLTITRNVADLIIAALHTLISFMPKSSDLAQYVEQQHSVIAHMSARIQDFTELANEQAITKGQDKTSAVWICIPQFITIPEELQLLRTILTYDQPHLLKALSDTTVLPVLHSLIKRKYEWDNSIANDNKQLGLRIRCCEIFQSIQRIGGTTILEQFALSNYSGALIQVVVTSFDECDSVVMTAMDNIASFFIEIHGFRQIFGLRRVGHTNIVPQIELIKTSEEQIEEEGGIEEIEAKLLNEQSNGLRRVARINQINVMQAILNISSVNNPNINNFQQRGIHDIFRRRGLFFPGIINNNLIEGDNIGPRLRIIRNNEEHQIIRNNINNNNPIIGNPNVNNNNNNPNFNNFDDDIIDLNGPNQFHGQRQRRLRRRDPRF